MAIPGSYPKTEPPILLPETSALIVQGRGGDGRAVEALIRRYQGQIAKFILRETGDEANYEDICQTVFVQMVLALPRLHSIERFESWLFKIARNACRDHLRRQRRWRRHFIPLQTNHDFVAEAEGLRGAVKADMIERGIDLLPEAQRVLLRLSLGRTGKTYQDLALATNLSVAAVKSRLYRARQCLRAMLLTIEGESS